MQGLLGFTPTSNSTKPPHIANGLFRECTGEICDFRDVHEWIVSERRKDAISSEDIVKKYDNILLKGTNENPSNIKHVRFCLKRSLIRIIRYIPIMIFQLLISVLIGWLRRVFRLKQE